MSISTEKISIEFKFHWELTSVWQGHKLKSVPQFYDFSSSSHTNQTYGTTH